MARGSIAGIVTAAPDKDTAKMDAAFDEAAIEIEGFVGDCLVRGCPALAVFGALEAHRHALGLAAPTNPIKAMAEMLGRAEAERGKGQGRISADLRRAVRPPAARESVVDPSSGFRGIDHQFTEGLLRLDRTLERLLTRHAAEQVTPLPVFAALVMWTELVQKALKKGGTSWWALRKAKWSAHDASVQMLKTGRGPG